MGIARRFAIALYDFNRFAGLFVEHYRESVNIWTLQRDDEYRRAFSITRRIPMDSPLCSRTLQPRGNWESGLSSRQDEFTAIISQKNCISFTNGDESVLITSYRSTRLPFSQEGFQCSASDKPQFAITHGYAGQRYNTYIYTYIYIYFRIISHRNITVLISLLDLKYLIKFF